MFVVWFVYVLYVSLFQKRYAHPRLYRNPTVTHPKVYTNPKVEHPRVYTNPKAKILERIQI